jgi:hypothetical protein
MSADLIGEPVRRTDDDVLRRLADHATSSASPQINSAERHPPERVLSYAC